MLLAPISTGKFKYEHLTDSPQNLEEIKSFTVTRETGRGLERYLKEIAEHDEYAHSNRTYLVRDKKTNEIAAYFSLRTGSFTLKRTTQDGEDESKYTVPSRGTFQLRGELRLSRAASRYKEARGTCIS